uniref:Uncharacterized protein n=2 Tax=Octopus bimaculoides TaxID=37653 RepID=A0A0L8I1R0_OCTBM|eukprot:XP_014767581.1 PREDICTED: Golgi-specific brefeldin A-resistance guanine nucleotide exchange factor 1-like [Octopus bimaculoides]
MDKYMHKGSDLLSDAIRESLKNMLLVMDTAGIFHTDTTDSQLWKLTWDRIDTFLPELQEELFKTQEPVCVPEPRNIDRNNASLEKVVVMVANEDIQPDPQITLPVTNNNGTAKVPDSPSSQNSDVQTPSPDSGIGKSPRSESPLVGGNSATMTSAYILQPPLPKVASRSSMADNMSVNSSPVAPRPNITDSVTVNNSSSTSGSIASTASTVPLLLNPDIMQGTTIPFISPQMERHESQ